MPLTDMLAEDGKFFNHEPAEQPLGLCQKKNQLVGQLNVDCSRSLLSGFTEEAAQASFSLFRLLPEAAGGVLSAFYIVPCLAWASF